MAAYPGILLVDLPATDVPCQPKVSDLENKALGYENIPGCQVTVDNLWQEGGEESGLWWGMQYGCPRKEDVWQHLVASSSLDNTHSLSRTHQPYHSGKVSE